MGMVLLQWQVGLIANVKLHFYHMGDILVVQGPERARHFLNFSNQTIIKGDKGNFVKPCLSNVDTMVGWGEVLHNNHTIRLPSVCVQETFKVRVGTPLVRC